MVAYKVVLLEERRIEQNFTEKTAGIAGICASRGAYCAYTVLYPAGQPHTEGAACIRYLRIRSYSGDRTLQSWRRHGDDSYG